MDNVFFNYLLPMFIVPSILLAESNDVSYFHLLNITLFRQYSHITCGSGGTGNYRTLYSRLQRDDDNPSEANQNLSCGFKYWLNQRRPAGVKYLLPYCNMEDLKEMDLLLKAWEGPWFPLFQWPNYSLFLSACQPHYSSTKSPPSSYHCFELELGRISFCGLKQRTLTDRHWM